MLSLLALAVAAVASGALTRSGNSDAGSMPSMTMHDHAASSTAAAAPKAVQLRIALNQLLGEHALLAIQATQRGLVGGKDFPAVAAQLDKNSVAISQAIGSLYGPAAGKQFLNGKFLWRDHIKFVVAYTVATAKHDSAGQKKAVANLMTYIQVQAAFFAKATGLPKQALVNDLTAHVLQLKGQLDAYAKGDYARAYSLSRAAYAHMGMTADVLAAGIAKQKKLGSTVGPKANLEVALDRLLGEHALLATWATQSGFSGDKVFTALAGALDQNSVDISKAIGSVYGDAAATQFLDGKFLWRDHIKFFVAYTVATAKHDSAGQKKAVANLMTYIQTQAAFFAKATGLPKKTLVNDLTAHVLQLKGQLDAYASGDYARAYSLSRAAYAHMGMTADVLAAGIAKQKHLGSTVGPKANLEIALDRLLGEHALLATWATQSGFSGDKGFTALAGALDQNSVDISKAIGSVYGDAAATQFLDGKFLW
ncbi:MAG: hypothetical protein QOD85_1612, partial [Gaiellaceae bacterium]|nr:hypothetical protein [Gaiellaceae bacterium]